MWRIVTTIKLPSTSAASIFDFEDGGSTTAMNVLFSEVRELELNPLPAEEQALLARAAKAGDKTASNKLIETNLKLVAEIARRMSAYQERWYADFFQVGSIGLLEATKKYDPEKGCAFSTYATYWIKREIVDYIQNNAGATRLPRYIADKCCRLNKTQQMWLQVYGSDPTDEQLAQKLNWDVNTIRKVKSATLSTVPLDAPVSGSQEDCLGELLPETAPINMEEIADNITLNQSLSAQIASMQYAHRKMLCMRFGLFGSNEHTLREIGETFGNLSRERIRQILNAEFRRMRIEPKEVKKFSARLNENDVENIRAQILKLVIQDWEKAKTAEERNKLESFFLSKWGQLLSGNSGELILDKLWGRNK